MSERSNTFLISFGLCAVVGVVSLVFTQEVADGVQRAATAFFGAVGRPLMISISMILIALVALALSPIGTRRLGEDDDRPEFSTPSWLAMLFAAGMGTGLVFWGVAEPMTHASNSPVSGNAQSETLAIAVTHFHWGLHAWAIYGAEALVLAYFAFRRGSKYLAGEPIRLVFGGPVGRGLAHTTDLLAIVAIAMGVGGSLAMGTFQLHTGLHEVFGIAKPSTFVSIAIMAALFVTYMTSAATSLDKGIRILSNTNMLIAVGLLLFVFAVGPTLELSKGIVTSTVGYATEGLKLSVGAEPYATESKWFGDWTLTYMMWWIAWAPFVGVFVARISKGRTIREFVFGVLIAPTAFSIVWFALFGGIGFAVEAETHTLASQVAADEAQALFSLYQSLPGTMVLSVLTLILIFIFLATSVDSATFVLGMLTSDGQLNPPTGKKLAWGIALAVLGSALAFTESVPAVKALAVSGALLFCFVMVAQLAAFVIVLRRDSSG